MRDLICIIPVGSLCNSKSRLSGILSEDERINLLKCMLKDIIHAIDDEVYDTVIVSKDNDIYEFAKQIGVSFIKESEYEDNHLNNALKEAISSVKVNYPHKDILIVPCDIPLIKKEHIISVKSSQSDMIISPSRGGGTNLLYFNSDFEFETYYGDMSYFRHLDEAYAKSMSVNVIESFYVSLDVNTVEDLGEILLHAVGTYTYEYLSKLNITVKSSHTQERLDVKRNDE